MVTHFFEDGILEVTVKGDITLSEIVEFLGKFSKLDDLPLDLLLLYDLENANMVFDPSVLKSLSQTAESSTNKYISIKTAFLTNDPKLNAYSTLFSNHTKNSKTERKIFSTKKAALKWLKQGYK